MRRSARFSPNVQELIFHVRTYFEFTVRDVTFRNFTAVYSVHVSATEWGKKETKSGIRDGSPRVLARHARVMTYTLTPFSFLAHAAKS